ncbi:hypothetical protein EV207_111101 [Scopulibacillus darangshiensis]|uniref:DUF4025 domain-containing protein n=1 Tax=Scopulibacillus darangshiensis TaxID=442528 RepID=A0A4R2P3D9_9BACL|nr:hypothetical protein [Scopulibacillus darangshiensis]TCP29299.1 hypothetical protein EV207_111101 [Scopulibacillus darangshiensis]
MTHSDKNIENNKYEGKKDYAFDVDRMINEGLGGGTVNLEYDHPAIDEARPLDDEDPPKADNTTKRHVDESGKSEEE